MALALSSYDGNEPHSPRARWPTGSFRGNDSRGNCAPTVSGPLQSRHTQQLLVPSSLFTPFVFWAAPRVEAASIWATDGLDVMGMGGGVSVQASSLGLDGICGRVAGVAGVLTAWPLPKPLIVPKGSLRGAGFSSSNLVAIDAGAGVEVGLGDLAGLDGNRGGRLGRGAGVEDDDLLLVVRASCNLEACLARISFPRASFSAASCTAASFALASSSRFEGGSAGRLAGSYVGGSARVLPTEMWLVLEDVVRPNEDVEMAEFCEITEEPEFRRAERYVDDWVDVRRGKAGGVCTANDGVLSGSGGRNDVSTVEEVSLLATDAEVSLRGSGGGAFVFAGRAGIAGCNDPLTAAGTVSLLVGLAGRRGGAGGGGLLSGCSTPVGWDLKFFLLVESGYSLRKSAELRLFCICHCRKRTVMEG